MTRATQDVDANTTLGITPVRSKHIRKWAVSRMSDNTISVVNTNKTTQLGIKLRDDLIAAIMREFGDEFQDTGDANAQRAAVHTLANMAVDTWKNKPWNQNLIGTASQNNQQKNWQHQGQALNLASHQTASQPSDLLTSLLQAQTSRHPTPPRPITSSSSTPKLNDPMEPMLPLPGSRQSGVSQAGAPSTAAAARPNPSQRKPKDPIPGVNKAFAVKPKDPMTSMLRFPGPPQAEAPKTSVTSTPNPKDPMTSVLRFTGPPQADAPKSGVPFPIAPRPQPGVYRPIANPFPESPVRGRPTAGSDHTIGSQRSGPQTPHPLRQQFVPQTPVATGYYSDGRSLTPASRPPVQRYAPHPTIPGQFQLVAPAWPPAGYPQPSAPLVAASAQVTPYTIPRQPAGIQSGSPSTVPQARPQPQPSVSQAAPFDMLSHARSQFGSPPTVPQSQPQPQLSAPQASSPLTADTRGSIPTPQRGHNKAATKTVTRFSNTYEYPGDTGVTISVTRPGMEGKEVQFVLEKAFGPNTMHFPISPVTFEQMLCELEKVLGFVRGRDEITWIKNDRAQRDHGDWIRVTSPWRIENALQERVTPKATTVRLQVKNVAEIENRVILPLQFTNPNLARLRPDDKLDDGYCLRPATSN